MPAKSKAQQRLMGLAYGNPEVRKQIGISKGDARKFAKTKHDNLPERVREEMDPLQELWNLYELNLVDKPDLSSDVESGMGTPQDGDKEHPVIQTRKAVDDLRQQGLSAEDAHQEVYGQVDLSDTESKADFSKTLGRVQQSSEKHGVKLEKDAEFKSLAAKDAELEKAIDQTTPMDLRTPQNQQIPDRLQPQDQTPQDTQESVDIQEEDWYNFDVAYIQQFGRG